MPRYLIYCRKSSEAEDRQVLSVESQVSELRALAERRGLSVLDVLTESRSAKAPGRPVFNSMMERISRGEAAGMICWKLDRLARNPVDGGSVIWAIKQHGLEIVTPTQTFSQADDNMILMYIEFGMAQKYIDDLSRNVKRGLRAKAEKGWYPCVAPLGYMNTKVNEKGEQQIVKDPERFPLVRRIWDLALTGRYSPPQILRIANERWRLRTRPTRRLGGRPLARSAIYRILTDPFYYGSFEYPRRSGLWHKGKHEPMITLHEYDRVQTFLRRRGNPRPVSRFFPFTGLIRCGECSAMVTAEEKHQLICPVCRLKFAYRTKDCCPGCQTPIEKMDHPQFLHYTYYHCTRTKNPACPQRSIDAVTLEWQIEDYLSRISVSERMCDWMIQYLHEFSEHETLERAVTLRAQQKAYHDCVARLGNLLTLKTSPQNRDGALLSDDEYGHQRSTLLKEKAHLEELLQDTGYYVTRWVELTEKTFEFARSARSWFANGDATTKKAILTAIGSNLILRDKILFIEAKSPFLVLEKSLPRLRATDAPFEPKKIRSTKGPVAVSAGSRPSGLPRRDDARTENVTPEQLVRDIYRAVQECNGTFSLPDLRLDPSEARLTA